MKARSRATVAAALASSVPAMLVPAAAGSVDYPTLERVPKDSFAWFRSLIRDSVDRAAVEPTQAD
jgi:hypothetical protein